MYSSVQPGTQIGVHVSPFVIELSDIMKLKITVTSKPEQRQTSSRLKLTFGLDLIELIREYIDHVQVCNHHSKAIRTHQSLARFRGRTYASLDGRSALFTAALKTSLAANGILKG